MFPGTQERVRNNRGKRAISVRATEVLLYVHEVLVNRLGGLSLPRKSVVRLTDRPDMTLDVYRGRKTPMLHQGRCMSCRQRNPAMMRVVRPTVPSNLLVETGLMGRCEGVFMR